MGFLSDIFGGGDSKDPKVSFQTIPQTEEAKKARTRLSELAAGPPPAVPRRKIAPLPPITEERKLARTTAKELIQPQDFLSLPEVQGIIQESIEQGDLLANRLGRGLQAAGAFTSTPGRDVLGRAVTNVQKSLAASLAPFAAEERRRRTGLIPVLEGLGLTEEERARGVTQAEKDALFQQQLTESEQLQTFTIPLLQSIIGLQPGVLPIISGGGAGPTSLEGLSGIIGPLLTSVLQSGDGGGQTGGAGTAKSGSFLGDLSPTGSSGSDIQLALQLAAALSDSVLKTNIETIPDAIEKIKQLDGKTFKFINGIKSGGVIAQEIEKVIPDAVGDINGIKTVDYTAIIGLLINAIKELARKVS